jgi:hypothetical protein
MHTFFALLDRQRWSLYTQKIKKVKMKFCMTSVLLSYKNVQCPLISLFLIAKGDHYTHKKIERKNEILYDISSIKLQEVCI